MFFLVCLLDFEVIEGKVVVDQSGKGNNAYLDKSAVVRPHDQMCGHYADLTGDGDIILVDKTFRGKPQTGITIACWVNLQGSLTAKHSLFSTVRMVSPVSFIGMYNFNYNFIHFFLLESLPHSVPYCTILLCIGYVNIMLRDINII